MRIEVRARRPFLLLTALVAALLPSAAGADWSDLLPIPFGTSVFLEAYGAREEQETTGNATRNEFRDTFLRERVSVESSGYWYSPRFLLYDVSAGLGRKQERYEEGELTSETEQATSTEYDARLTFLPEHPYNLILTASRWEPLTRARSFRPYDAVLESRGIRFRYRDQPYFLEASLVRDSVISGSSGSHTTRADLSGEYFRRFTSGTELGATFGAKRSTFEAGGASGGTIEELHAGSLLVFRAFRVTTDLSQNRFRQELDSGRIESRQDLFRTFASGLLPAGFRAELEGRWQRSGIEVGGGASARDFDDETTEARLLLAHRLYRSLDSALAVRRIDRSSASGRTSSLSTSLTFDYVKRIPRGSLLAGFSGSRTELDSRGVSTDVVDEPHPSISVPTATILLARRDVVAGSVVLTVRDPDPPHETFRLEEGVHYDLRQDPGLGSVELLVHSLPSELPVPGIYDFLVSYTVSGGDYSLRTDSVGWNGSVELFENLLTPYASYLEISSETLSGRPTGVPVDSRTTTFGLRGQKGPFRGFVERQRQESDLAPYELRRGELDWSDTVGPTTSLYLALIVQDRNREPSSFDPADYHEKSETVSGTLSQRVPGLGGLTASLGGSWSRVRGFVRSEAWSANASVGLRIGKLDLSAGASAYSAETLRETGGPVGRDHRWYFLKVRRRID